MTFEYANKPVFFCHKIFFFVMKIWWHTFTPNKFIQFFPFLDKISLFLSRTNDRCVKKYKKRGMKYLDLENFLLIQHFYYAICTQTMIFDSITNNKMQFKGKKWLYSIVKVGLWLHNDDEGLLFSHFFFSFIFIVYSIEKKKGESDFLLILRV